jgi:transcriptional regulator with XRE-family HTH domain
MPRGRGITKYHGLRTKNRILKLYAIDKLNGAEIGRRLGLSRQYVSRVIRKANGDEAETTNKTRYIDVSEQIEYIRKCLPRTLAEIAEEIGVARETVSRWANGRAKLDLRGKAKAIRALNRIVKNLNEDVQIYPDDKRYRR